MRKVIIGIVIGIGIYSGFIKYRQEIRQTLFGTGQKYILRGVQRMDRWTDPGEISGKNPETQERWSQKFGEYVRVIEDAQSGQSYVEWIDGGIFGRRNTTVHINTQDIGGR